MDRKFCTACGAALAEGGAFCVNCGAAVPGSAPSASHPPAPAENWVGASVPHAPPAAPQPAMPAQLAMPPEMPPPGYGHPPGTVPGFQTTPATAQWGWQRWLLLAVGAIFLAGGVWRLGLIGPTRSSPPSAPVSSGSPAPAPAPNVPAGDGGSASPGLVTAEWLQGGAWSPDCAAAPSVSNLRLHFAPDGVFRAHPVGSGLWRLAGNRLTLTDTTTSVVTLRHIGARQMGLTNQTGREQVFNRCH